MDEAYDVGTPPIQFFQGGLEVPRPQDNQLKNVGASAGSLMKEQVSLAQTVASSTHVQGAGELMPCQSVSNEERAMPESVRF